MYVSTFVAGSRPEVDYFELEQVKGLRLRMDRTGVFDAEQGLFT